MKLKLLTIVFLLVAITGCGKQESKQPVVPETSKKEVVPEASKKEVIPEASSASCTNENKNKYGPDFAEKCMRLGTYTKSTGRQWNFNGSVPNK